jgi:hypothetical protein
MNDVITVTLSTKAAAWLTTHLTLEIQERVESLQDIKSMDYLHPSNGKITAAGIAHMGHLLQQIFIASAKTGFNPLTEPEDADMERY